MGLGGAALLLALLALAQGQRLMPPRQAWPGIVIGGLLTVAAFNLCTTFAQLNTSTSRAAVLTYTMPMLSALLAWPLLGERLSRRSSIAVALGGAGIALLAWPALSGMSATTAASGGGPASPAPAQSATLGLVMPLLAATAWAGGTIAAKRWPLHGDRLVHTAWQLGLGGVAGLLGAAAAGESLPRVWPWPVLLALGYHIVIATALAYVLWFMLLARFSVSVSALTTLMVPVVGVLGAMLLVGDRPSVADWLGFVLVLAGAGLSLFQLKPSR